MTEPQFLGSDLHSSPLLKDSLQPIPHCSLFGRWEPRVQRGPAGCQGPRSLCVCVCVCVCVIERERERDAASGEWAFLSGSLLHPQGLAWCLAHSRPSVIFGEAGEQVGMIMCPQSGLQPTWVQLEGRPVPMAARALWGSAPRTAEGGGLLPFRCA